MPRYHVTLTDTEIQELKSLIQKGGKGYRIKHAQILLKLDQKPENSFWTYDRIKEAYGASHSTIFCNRRHGICPWKKSAKKPTPKRYR